MSTPNALLELTRPAELGHKVAVMRLPSFFDARIWFLASLSVGAATACGRRVTSESRETPTPVSTSPATPVKPPKIVANGAPENEAAVVHLTPERLDSLIRQAHRKGTLVNVWATWCGPCREELPMLAKVSMRLENRGLVVLPLSVDEPENESKIAPMLKEFGFHGPYYVAQRPLEALKQSLDPTWPGNIPVSFLLDDKATRRFFWTAQVYESELLPKLEAFLAGALDRGRADFPVAPGKTL
ncbi:MAG: TlpA disulfide reductase family protein [Polyangiaceae bacterium]